MPSLNIPVTQTTPELWASLPRNEIALAKAALAGGAQAIKVHLNAFHRASGSRFGTFQEELPFLEALAALPGKKAVMIGQEVLPSRNEMLALADLGFTGFNLYLKHARAPGTEWLISPEITARITPYLALEHGFGAAELKQILAIPSAQIEASFVDPNDYGQGLTLEDMRTYRELVQSTGRTVIVPSQKKILPQDVPALRDTGIQVLLLGVIAVGATPESFESGFRNFSDALSR